MRIVVEPCEWKHAAATAAVAAEAAACHGLPDLLDSLVLVLDDLAADERPWLRRTGPRSLEIYAHPDAVLAERADDLVGTLPTLPWEWRDGEAPEEPRGFSTAAAERFLHHQLLAAADLLTGRIRPRDIPPEDAEAFQEAWAVTVDGRLRRRSLPGLPIADRRRRFLRVFGATAVLLPQHWALFHALWESDEPDQEALLADVSRLPPISHRRR